MSDVTPDGSTAFYKMAAGVPFLSDISEFLFDSESELTQIIRESLQSHNCSFNVQRFRVNYKADISIVYRFTSKDRHITYATVYLVKSW